MDVEFDPAKDVRNIDKHGLSLALAVELEEIVVVPDSRFVGEQRFRLYGTIKGQPHCLAAVFRNGVVRPTACVARTERSISVMADKEDVVFDEDNPEWTEADFARARPISDFPGLAAAFPNTKRRPGRPFGSTTSERQQVTLRLPKSVIEHFKAGGPGWQTRAIAVLEREAERGRS